MFALTEAPPVISATRARSQGVTAAPAMPASSASRIACSIAARAMSSGSASASGTGLQITSPEVRPIAAWARMTAAAAAMSGTWLGAGIPDSRE